ncbi:MAG: hypothetical protein AB1705_10845 [Verrucomicrobiota bacterium]
MRGLLILFAIAFHGEAADMVFPGKDWAEAAPESQGINGAKLAGAIAFLKERAGRDGVNELVVVHNGYHMFVIPEWNMVIVRLGLDQGDREITDADYNGFLKMVGQAFVIP